MRWHIPILLAPIAPLLLSGSLYADTPSPPSDAPQGESFLVLLSGEVIQGQISKLDDKYVVVLPTGRMLIRNICMVFDAYIRKNQKGRFSKVI